MNQFRSITSTMVLGFVAASLLASCGGKTNPTDAYQNLPATPPKPVVTKDQANFAGGCRAIGVADDQVPLFTEGKTSQYAFNAGCYYAGVTYDLVASGLPDDATFARSTDPKSPDQFILSWTPKKGLIIESEHGTRLVKFSLTYKLGGSLQGLPDDVKAQNGKQYVFTLVLRNNDQDPEITAVKLASSSITRGEKVAITVEATDPSAFDGHAPEIKIEDDNAGATDNGVIKAASFIAFNTPTASGDGKFVFQGILDSANITVPDGRNDITARALVSIKGVVGLKSSTQRINVTVMKKIDPLPAAKPIAKTGSSK